jgi:putative Holliday junction resolvase
MTTTKFDPNKSALSLDVGEKRIGVAAANLGVRFAAPLTTLENPQTFLADIAALCQAEDAGLVVIGLPRGMQGQETHQTERVREFGSALGDYLGEAGLQLPLYWIDEALTSEKAEAELRDRRRHPNFRKSDVDALAATYILEDFLKEFHG